MAGKLPSLTSKAVIYENCSDDDDNEDTGNDHHLGLSLEKLNLGPRKKLLVLGLGGLLVQRVYSRYGVRTNVQTRRRPDGIAGNFLGENFVHNTAIFPDSYKVENGNDTVLGPKGELQEFLDGLSDVDDVQSYVKENRVGQPAITETHAEWNYHSKIVPKFC